MSDEKVYITTLRVYGDKDIQLVKNLTNEFSSSSLSKCIVHVIREYYKIRRQLEKIQNILEKSVKIKYEIPENIVKELF